MPKILPKAEKTILPPMPIPVEFRQGALSNLQKVAGGAESGKIYHVLPTEYENWAKQAAPYFQQVQGLAGTFALQAARLYIALWGRGLSPRISRGWSDPAHQKALQARWDAGQRAGLRVRPATNSKHSATSFTGAPASQAIDMPCSDDRAAAVIARQLGIGAGIDFKDSDPGHYFQA